MKCYYTFDEVTKQKVLIPCCMSVIHSYDIDDCCCNPFSYEKFSNERYNKLIDERNNEIKFLHTELKRLVGILKRKQT